MSEYEGGPSDLGTIGGGGGGGTNPGGGGGVTNSAFTSIGGGGGGATNAGVGFGATICGVDVAGEGLVDPLPALKMGGTLDLLSCPEVITLTDSGGPVVVETLEREPGPVRRVVCWTIASFKSLTSPMLLRLIRMSIMAVRLRWGILRSDSRFFLASVGGNRRS